MVRCLLGYSSGVRCGFGLFAYCMTNATVTHLFHHFCRCFASVVPGKAAVKRTLLFGVVFASLSFCQPIVSLVFILLLLTDSCSLDEYSCRPTCR